MAQGKWLELHDIPRWCAGTKVSGFGSEDLNTLTWRQVVNRVLREWPSSCVCVTTNTNEVGLMNWLQKNKFIQGPAIKNSNHGGRLTHMWFRQISSYDRRMVNKS